MEDNSLYDSMINALDSIISRVEEMSVEGGINRLHVDLLKRDIYTFYEYVSEIEKILNVSTLDDLKTKMSVLEKNIKITTSIGTDVTSISNLENEKESEAGLVGDDSAYAHSVNYQVVAGDKLLDIVMLDVEDEVRENATELAEKERVDAELAEKERVAAELAEQERVAADKEAEIEAEILAEMAAEKRTEDVEPLIDIEPVSKYEIEIEVEKEAEIGVDKVAQITEDDSYIAKLGAITRARFGGVIDVSEMAVASTVMPPIVDEDKEGITSQESKNTLEHLREVSDIVSKVGDGINSLRSIVSKYKVPQAVNEQHFEQKQAMCIHIGINDKMLFINELFKGDSDKYTKLIDELSAMEDHSQAKNILDSHKKEFNWQEDSIAYMSFMDIFARSFIL